MNDLARAFGRGIVKILISLFVGVGIAMAILGYCAKDKPQILQPGDPSSEVYLAFDIGLVTSGLVLGALFIFPKAINGTVATGKQAFHDDSVDVKTS